ncbi:MAG: hypothetical protein ED859_05690 [Desulfuromonadales bacterium]|nr:MAG: hypothetical protein ED859_05690 [Desulfuromonadales bacterium]
MKIHRLERSQCLPVTLAEAWAFFVDPCNLCLITPPDLGFAITSPVPSRTYPGLVITYTVTPFAGIPVRWVTEITHAEEPRFFVDEQRFGPYRFWHHQHLFREVTGGVEMDDIVHYGLPFGLLGGIAAPLVARRLASIFDFRRTVLADRFGTMD